MIDRVVDAEDACCMSSRLPFRFDSCSLARCSSCSQVCLPGCRRFNSVVNDLARVSCVLVDLNSEIRKWIVYGRRALIIFFMDVVHRERKFIMGSYVSLGMSKIDSHFDLAASSAVPYWSHRLASTWASELSFQSGRFVILFLIKIE